MAEAQQSHAQLQQTLQADEAVTAVAILGSVAQSRADEWSDLDLLIVVEDAAFDRFFPALAWLEPCGELFAYEQSASPFVGVTRVCFADFRRLDCVITTEAALARLAEWPHAPHLGERSADLRAL